MHCSLFFTSQLEITDRVTKQKRFILVPLQEVKGQDVTVGDGLPFGRVLRQHMTPCGKKRGICVLTGVTSSFKATGFNCGLCLGPITTSHRPHL